VNVTSTAELREMRWWDIEAVLELEQELFPEDAWSPGMFWSELAQTRHPEATRYYVVAHEDGRVVGYAGLMTVDGAGDVQTIGVTRSRWGTGLGARLLGDLIRQAGVLECGSLMLEVRVDNDRAQRLYERFGFVPIGVRRGYYQPSNTDALVMLLGDPASAAAAARPST
jgi:[ribosomal protein S18]-alanine N-acetyltransferase